MNVYRRSFSDLLLPRMDMLFHRRTQSIPVQKSIPVRAHAACRFSHALLSVRCYPASESSGGNCGADFRSHIYHIILPIFRQVEGTRQIIERSTTIGGYRMKKLAIYVHGIGGKCRRGRALPSPALRIRIRCRRIRLPRTESVGGEGGIPTVS